jgi:hypothetical protein
MRQPDRGSRPPQFSAHCVENVSVCAGNAALPAEFGPLRERPTSHARISPEPIHNAGV